MNWKKVSFIFIVFLTFLATGFLLSNVQSREADQQLEAHGMSNNTRYFYPKGDEKIQDFLLYLTKHYPKSKIQLHLENKKDKEQVLVWSNHNVQALPTQSGHYFNLEDFKGQVSFAVLGPDTVKNILEVQNNRYVIYHQRYYSVIGEFKNYHQKEQTNYYLTTGTNQPTAQFKLKNYRVLFDCNYRSTLTKVAKNYHAQLKVPAFVRTHQQYRFSVIKEIVLIILLWVLALLSNMLIASMQWRQVRLTHLKGKLLHNWIFNRGLRLILIETLLALAAWLLLRWYAFFNKPDHLTLLLMMDWLVAVFSYLLTWIMLYWREKKNAATSRGF